MGSGNVTIGDLLDSYLVGKAVAEELGFNLQDSYSFERYLTDNNGNKRVINISIRLQ